MADKQDSFLSTAYIEAIINAKPLLSEWRASMRGLETISERAATINNTIADLIIDILIDDYLNEMESVSESSVNCEQEVIINGLSKILLKHSISIATENGCTDLDERVALKHLCNNKKLYMITNYLDKMLLDIDAFLLMTAK